MVVINGSTAYLPSSISVNGVAAAASGIPATNTTYNNITFWWQGGTAPTAANVSTGDSYTFTVVCTGSSTWTVIASQVKF